MTNDENNPNEQTNGGTEDEEPGDGWGGIGEGYQERGPTSETNEMTGTNNTDKTNIRDEWNGRTIYLPDEDVEEVDILFDQLSLEARQQGKEIKKNRDFYPAIFRAALRHTDTIRDELNLG